MELPGQPIFIIPNAAIRQIAGSMAARNRVILDTFDMYSSSLAGV
jgi:hypothetical protein